MKHLIIIIALLTTAPVLAQDITCKSMGTSATFILKDSVLLDTNENVMAAKVAPNRYEATDQFGTVSYTVEPKKIVMKFDHITKEYTCDL